MPSSTLVACRASVMLGSMIALPAAALFWPSFPAAVDCVMASVGQRPRIAGAASSAEFADSELGEAPRFSAPQPMGPFAFAQNAASGSIARPLSSQEQPQLVPPPSRGPLPVARADGPVPAGYVSVPHSGIGSGLPRTAPPEPPTNAATPGNSWAQHGVREMHPTSMRGDAGPAGVAGASSTIQNLQQQLRSRGATYSLLEMLGAEKTEYRFHCRVAVAGNARYTRQFEATHGDPLVAMQVVLNQIASWQSGRTP